MHLPLHGPAWQLFFNPMGQAGSQAIQLSFLNEAHLAPLSL